jgi:hypothetical protein
MTPPPTATSPSTLEPAQFQDLLVNAVDSLAPASPPIDAMRERALCRRYLWITAGFAALAAAAVPAAVVVADRFASHSAQQTVSVVPPWFAPIPPSPATQQRLRHDVHLCQQYAAGHTFLQATSAVVEGSSVSIIGHRGSESCGGADDVSYLHRKAIATFTLAPGATIGAVVIGRQRDRQIAATALPGYLRHTQFGFFRYSGPPTAITQLTELYHP